ncbi:hypothetical protein LHV18_18960 [Providencia rettgeri]|uniref:hypothetical protein n=1 Tax=Providencia TaxID=586 RepID=UPI000D6F4994|nr:MULTISPECIES: hypothetical protein [Providencia]ELR5152523.1 hypothetical protein [Providencia rettgeri]MCB4842700.1 hypothetical protein [Providencia rettgeri]
MNIINIKIVINTILFFVLITYGYSVNANTKVIGLTINESSLDDVNKLYTTERDGNNGYLISHEQIPIDGVEEAFVTIHENKVKVVGFKFFDSKYPYLRDLLKSKYKLISEDGDYPFPATATFENDGDMIFLKKDFGKSVDLIYVNKEFNILVNKSVKKRKETERDNDFGHL